MSKAQPPDLNSKEKLMRKGILALLFLVLCPWLIAQQTMNNDAIIKLVKAGLSDDVVVSTINASSGTYDTSVNGLITLKHSGVSDKVIAAVVAKSAKPATPSAPPAASLPFAAGVASVSYKQGDQWTEIDPERFAIKTGGFLKSFATAGMRMVDISGHISGRTSKVALKAPATFHLSLPQDVQIGDCQLVKLHVNRNNREFRSSTGGYLHVSTEESTKDSVPFDSKRIAPHMYTVTLPSGTAAGEYGFLIGSPNTIYTFSIFAP